MKRNNRALSMVERNLEAARSMQHILPPIATVEVERFASLLDLPATIEVSPGTVLVEQGTHPRSVSLLSCGLVRLISVDAEGRQTTLGLRTAGWYAGAVQAILNTPSPYSVVAVTNCSLCAIPASEFPLKLAQNTTLMQHFVSVLCNEVSAQTGGNTARTASQAKAAQSESRLAWQEFARRA